MRIVVVGATGNVGTSLLAALQQQGTHDVAGLARRPPRDAGGVDWIRADIRHDDLEAAFRGADAVVHLAWAIQPSHDMH